MAVTRHLLLLCLLIAASLVPGYTAPPSSSTATTTTVLLVRHAEKAKGADPPLTPAGTRRARDLVDAIGKAGVSAIITSEFLRTRQTAAPLAEQLDLTPTVFPAGTDDLAQRSRELAAHIHAHHHGKTTLIVGHSNTVPMTIAALGVDRPPAIGDADYDRLFIVTIAPDDAARLEEIGYGAPSPVAPPPHVNIIFILIDDLGWMDLACQGNTLVETPNIDAFATQGMRFTDNYAAAPVCSPTRAAILTGLAPARLRITNHLPDQARFVPPDAELLPAAMLDHLPLEHVTIAERLQAVGYATAFIGKWHLSRRDDPTFLPGAQGFDLNIGGCSFGGPPTFFDPYRIPTLPDRRAGEYLPDRLADESIAFIRANRERPFMLFLWNYTVHWPMEAPKALLAKYADRTGPGLNDTRYGAMIEAMDTAIGRVLDELDRLELADDTLVVFTSDNGAYGGVGDNRPLRADKGHLYEGGIRVPLIVRWPGVVAPGTTCATPVVSMDFFPTLLDAAGLPRDAAVVSDGVSLMPLLRGAALLDREAIYFHYPNYAFHRSNRLGSAVRAGRYKLIENFDDGSVELYDLESDVEEQHDLATGMPEKAETLRRMLRVWRRETGAALPTRREN